MAEVWEDRTRRWSICTAVAWECETVNTIRGCYFDFLEMLRCKLLRA